MLARLHLAILRELEIRGHDECSSPSLDYSRKDPNQQLHQVFKILEGDGSHHQKENRHKVLKRLKHDFLSSSTDRCWDEMFASCTKPAAVVFSEVSSDLKN